MSRMRMESVLRGLHRGDVQQREATTKKTDIALITRNRSSMMHAGDICFGEPSIIRIWICVNG
jgi:hypothetical protein